VGRGRGWGRVSFCCTKCVVYKLVNF
jgi:hypothetical protein